MDDGSHLGIPQRPRIPPNPIFPLYQGIRMYGPVWLLFWGAQPTNLPYHRTCRCSNLGSERSRVGPQVCVSAAPSGEASTKLLLVRRRNACATPKITPFSCVHMYRKNKFTLHVHTRFFIDEMQEQKCMNWHGQGSLFTPLGHP